MYGFGFLISVDIKVNHLLKRVENSNVKIGSFQCNVSKKSNAKCSTKRSVGWALIELVTLA
jgi:hypothetical protein